MGPSLRRVQRHSPCEGLGTKPPEAGDKCACELSEYTGTQTNRRVFVQYWSRLKQSIRTTLGDMHPYVHLWLRRWISILSIFRELATIVAIIDIQGVRKRASDWRDVSGGVLMLRTTRVKSFHCWRFVTFDNDASVDDVKRHQQVKSVFGGWR